MVNYENELLNEFSFVELVKQMAKWRTSNEGAPKDSYTNYSLTDDEYNMLKESLHVMQTADDYATYKKSFNKFCKFCHILPTGTVLYQIALTKYKTLYVSYVYNTKKIDMPKDAKLYHMSKIKDIKELIPTFRSKQFNKALSLNNQYFYSSPRVYLTLNKTMSKWFADYNINDNVYQYIVIKPISQAYVDPLVNSYWNKAIYVETNNPISVMPIEKYQKDSSINEMTCTDVCFS